MAISPTHGVITVTLSTAKKEEVIKVADAKGLKPAVWVRSLIYEALREQATA